MEADKRLDGLCDDIVRLCSPKEIRMYNRKASPHGEITAVKLCIVAADDNPVALERRLYLDLESELPFDILVYSQAQWTQITRDETSFAAHIRRSGRLLYEAD